MATREEKIERRRIREAEEANRRDATGDATSDGATSEAVSASNVGSSEAAGKITRAQAEAEGDAGGPENPDKTRPADQANEDATAPSDAKKKDSGKVKKFDTVERFLELSGYEESDVIGHSDERRTVVTSNGGKYQISGSGKKLRKQSGPDTPKMVEEAAEAEEEE